MKRINPYLIVLVSILFLSCSERKSDVLEIEGKIDGMPSGVLVYLQELKLNNKRIIVDSVRSTDKGHFKLSTLIGNGSKLYSVVMTNKTVFILDDAKEITITGKWDEIENTYKIKGSLGSEKLSHFIHKMQAFDKQMAESHFILDKLNVDPIANDSLLKITQAQLLKTTSDQTQFVKGVADSSKFIPIAIMAALSIDNLLTDKPYFEQLMASMNKRFAKQPMFEEFKSFLTDYKKGVVKIAINQTAPNIVLNDVNGKSFSLEKLRGKYVLLDFWASWCPPCREETPNIVKAYKLFKGKNFEILGVSLDKDLDQWKNAIKADSITWTQISDLGGWKSSVVELYGLESIPSNFLIDPNGKVVATNLMGDELIETLNIYLNKDVELSKNEQ